jgi:hypothetical protein
MIHFEVRHQVGVLECHQLIAVPITTGKKKIQSSVHCYAIPITIGTKRYSSLAIICCAVPIAIVAPFQLRPEKKDTVVCPLLRHSNYDQKKKRFSCLAIIRCAVPIAIFSCAVPITTGKKKIQSSVRCYAIPITTGKKRYSCLAIIRCAVLIAIVAPFQLQPEKKDTVVCPLLRRSKYDRKRKKNLAGARSLEEKKTHRTYIYSHLLIWRVPSSNYDRKK